MKLLIFILCVSPFFAISQSTKIENDTLFLSNGLKFAKGQDLHFGNGSNSATKGFNYLYVNPGILNPNIIKLESAWNGLKMNIYGFKKYGSKKLGEKYCIILSGGNLAKYLCEIEPALETKEVIVKGYNDGSDKMSTTSSIPDELKKWKDLLDSGAITKEEYEAKKKKLLE